MTPVEIQPYTPKFYVKLPSIAEVGTAWNGIDEILYDIVARFDVPQNHALEFGVQFGYSTSALANVFQEVTGVDTFIGDVHAGYLPDHYAETRERLKQWPNIQLVQARYQDFIALEAERQYDLIHVDIVHTFDETCECGLWAVKHSPVVLFHDTLSFSAVMRAVTTVAAESGYRFYNFEPCHGLGILVQP